MHAWSSVLRTPPCHHPDITMAPPYERRAWSSGSHTARCAPRHYSAWHHIIVHDITPQACMVLGLAYRPLPTAPADGFKLRAATLCAAARDDVARGLTPVAIVATLGTRADARRRGRRAPPRGSTVTLSLRRARGRRSARRGWCPRASDDAALPSSRYAILKPWRRPSGTTTSCAFDDVPEIAAACDEIASLLPPAATAGAAPAKVSGAMCVRVSVCVCARVCHHRDIVMTPHARSGCTSTRRTAARTRACPSCSRSSAAWSAPTRSASTVTRWCRGGVVGASL